MIETRKYQDEQGRFPFDQDWLACVRDRRAVAKIRARIRRLSLGNEGDWKSVGENVRELRIPESKGYRVYYLWDGEAVVLLLCGGNKSTQAADIETAKEYRRDYYA